MGCLDRGGAYTWAGDVITTKITNSIPRGSRMSSVTGREHKYLEGSCFSTVARVMKRSVT